MTTRKSQTVSPFALESSRLLTVLHVAEVLGKKPPAVRALARRGEIAYHRIGRSLRFAPEDVRTFLARCRRPARSERGEQALAGL